MKRALLVVVAAMLSLFMFAGPALAYAVAGGAEDEINVQRNNRGKPDFQIKSYLEGCAGNQADWVENHNWTADETHLGACNSDGLAHGVVSGGADTSHQIVQFWLDSPDHKAIIMSSGPSGYKKIGCARVAFDSTFNWYVCVTSY